MTIQVRATVKDTDTTGWGIFHDVEIVEVETAIEGIALAAQMRTNERYSDVCVWRIGTCGGSIETATGLIS